MLLRIARFGFLAATSLQAQIPINNTLFDICVSSFQNCTAYTGNFTSCGNQFQTCSKNAQQNLRPPQSCYQAEAANRQFKYAWMAVSGIISVTITLAIFPIVFRFFVAKCTCKRLAWLRNWIEPEKKKPQTKHIEEGDSNEPDPNIVVTPQSAVELIKHIAQISIGKIASIFAGLLSIVSVTWLFPLWQASTAQQSICDYDLYRPLNNYNPNPCNR